MNRRFEPCSAHQFFPYSKFPVLELNQADWKNCHFKIVIPSDLEIVRIT